MRPGYILSYYTRIIIMISLIANKAAAKRIVRVQDIITRDTYSYIYKTTHYSYKIFLYVCVCVCIKHNII